MKNTKIASMPRSKSRAIALEPRLLFDGAGAIAGVDALLDNGETELEQNNTQQPQNEPQNNVPLNGASYGNNEEETETIEPQATGTEPQLEESKPEEDETNEPQATGTEPQLEENKPEDETNEPQATGTEPQLEENKPEDETNEPQATGTEPQLEESKPEDKTNEPQATGTEPQLEENKPEEDEANEPQATGTEPQLEASTEPEQKSGAMAPSGFGMMSFEPLSQGNPVGSFNSATNTADDPVITVGEDDGPTNVLGAWDVKGTGQITVAVSGAANGTLTHDNDLTFTGTAAEVNTWLKGVKYQYKTTDQSQTGDTDEITLTFTTYDSEEATEPTTQTKTQAINIAPQNDAPKIIAPGTGSTPALTLKEGGTLTFEPHEGGDDLGFSHAQLGISDPDNLAEQVIIKLTTIPDKADGKFVLNNITLEEGSNLSVQDLANLSFIHSGQQVLEPGTSISFTYTIDDGAGGRIENNEVEIQLIPVNQVPSITGSVTIIQGEGPIQIGGGGNLPVLGDGSIDRGKITASDPDDTELTYKITGLPKDANSEIVGQLVYDGLELTAANIGSVEITDLSKLTYAYPKDLEPKELGSTTGDDPIITFTIKVTDQGGGTGTPATSDELTVDLIILDNNNDPVLVNNVAQNYQELVDASKVTDNSFIVTSEMLKVTDPDSFNNNLVFKITSDVSSSAGGYFTRDDLLLDKGTSFTQQDIEDSLIKYHLRTKPSSEDRDDSLTFTVTDSDRGIIFPDSGDPFARDGGIYTSDTKGAALVEHTFTVTVPHTVTSDGNGELPGLPEVATEIITTGTGMSGVLESQGTATGTSGVKITETMLSTTDHDELDKATPPAGIVYRIESLPASGSIWLTGEGQVKELKQFSSFTQADINSGDVEFRHAGGEIFKDTLVLSVSNGNTVSAANHDFNINIVPQNDTPEASQVGEINVLEGKTITITGAHIGLSDRDIAADVGDEINDQYANKNDLWFVITKLPNTDVEGNYVGDAPKPTKVGKLQWNTGGDWVDITDSNIDTFNNGDGKITIQNLQDGKLRYFHNGTEDFADSFKITPYDNQGVVGADITATNQSSKGTETTINITIAPVNNPPVYKDKIEIIEELALYEGESAIIGGTHATDEQGQLLYVDQDNTTLQNQYLITEATKYGTLFKDGVALNKGSVFTQKDLDEGLIKYEHNSGEIHFDNFKYTVSDGDFTVNDEGVISGDNSDGALSSIYNIHVKPTNDKPEFSQERKNPVIVDGTDSRHNIIDDSPFQIKDIDLELDKKFDGKLGELETDLITAIVRVVDSDGKMLTGTDYSLSVDGSHSELGDTNVDSGYLQLTGTIANVNAALTTLGVGFNGDINNKDNYKLQVIVDDRLNDSKNGYQNGDNTWANGGDKNYQGKNDTTTIDQTTYDWTNAVITKDTSLNLNVAEVDLWVSTIKEPLKISAYY